MLPVVSWVDLSYLGISRIGIEYVREEFAGTCDSGDDQAMYVVAINHEEVRKIRLRAIDVTSQRGVSIVDILA